MRFSYKRSLTVIGVVICLSSCGGDIHEVSVDSSKVSTSTSKSIKARAPVSSSTLPRSTTSTTIDPKVRALQAEQLNEAIFKLNFAKFQNEQAKKRVVNHVSNPKGAHSDAWWHGVAICEQGGKNDSYFGYFSFMDGSAGGGKSWETQVQMANGIISRYGDHAWAQTCINAGYRASPGG